MKKKAIAMCLLLMVFVLCACGNKTYAETKENRADQENAEEYEDGGLVFDKPERFVIPKTRDKYGNQVLLGTINPEGADWGEGKEPLFLVTPGELTETYSITGSRHCIIRMDNYLLEVTLNPGVCPVWSITSYSDGKIIGVTNHCYIFRDGGRIYAVENSNATDGVVHDYDILPMAERESEKAVIPVSVEVPNNVQINGWDWNELELQVLEGGVVMSFPRDTVSNGYEFVPVESPNWYQFYDGRLFFVQQTNTNEPYEAVFVGAFEGNFQAIRIPFNGELRFADTLGIHYMRDGEHFFKSYYPVVINGKMEFPEVPEKVFIMGDFDFPAEIWGTYPQKSKSAEIKAPF